MSWTQLAFEPPAQKHSPTSVAAAESIKPHAETMRQRVFECLKVPATDQELAERLGLADNSVRPRRIELHQAGLVQPVGQKRTKSNRMAVVWGVK